MKASGKRSLIFICILVVFAVGLALSFGKFFNFESSDDESSQEEQEELFDGLIFMIGEEEHVRVSREDDFTSVPQAPEKPGYNFASWYMSIDGQEERLSANDLLALDRTGKTYIYAKYEIVTYQIYYKGNVGRFSHENATEYTVEDEVVLSDATQTGYNFKGWYEDEEYQKPITKISKGTVDRVDLYAKFEACEYSLSFVADGGSHDNPSSYKYDESVELTPAFKEHYVFTGWYYEDGFYKVTSISKNTMGDKTLIARYEPKEYTITYENEFGGDDEPANPTRYNIESSFKLLPEKHKGYTFLGWFNGDEEITEVNDCSRKDMTLTAKWVKTNFTVEKNINEAGSVTGFEDGTYIGEEVKLSAQTNSGYTWLGWYKDGEKVSQGYETSFTFVNTGEEATYVATWAAYEVSVSIGKGGELYLGHKVSFDLNGRTTIDTPETQYVNTLTKLQYPITERDGRYFISGWYTEPECENLFDWSSTITSDMTLYAKWSNCLNNLDTSLSTNIYGPLTSYYTNQAFVALGTKKINVYLKEFEYSKVYFSIPDDGSFEIKLHNIDLYQSSSTSLRGYIIYSKMINETQGTIIEGDVYKQVPGRQHYKTYSLNSENTNPGDVICLLISNSTGYGISYMTETFSCELTRYSTVEKAKGDVQCAEGMYSAGEEITMSVATKDGYSWLGWYDADNKLVSKDLSYTFEMPYDNVLLYPQWEAIEYPVSYTYDASLGGYASNMQNPSTYTVEDYVSLIDLECYKTGYCFAGWYYEGERVTVLPSSACKEIVLEARWEPIVYTITYINTLNATNNNVTTYTIESEEITLAALELAGYEFVEWTLNENPITSIPSGSYGDIQITANWLGVYKIKYNYSTAIGKFSDDVTPAESYRTIDTITLYDLVPVVDEVEFDGWYDQNGNKITVIEEGNSKDIILTAHWKTEYTIIETVNQLREISMDGKYLLANNLILGFYDWNPLGTEEAPFTGIFNGCGRSIYNLDISIENSKLSGLFGYNNGEIKNLTIKGAALEIAGETSPYIGTVAAINNGTISNCRFEGEVKADIKTDFGTLRFGGLVACNNGTIQNSSCSATICIENSDSSVDYGYCGILVGENSGTISKCFTEKSAKFVSRQVRAGGICGFNNGGTIENCYSTARVFGKAYAYKDAISYVGGISGYSSGKISNCYMSGDVEAYSRLLWLDTWQYLRSFAGGICGAMEREATLEGCVSIGDVYSHSTDYGGTGVNYYGSIIALNMDGTARNCYSNKDQSLDGYSIGAASGTKVSKEELLTATFYKETLNWDTSAWKIKDGTYPTLH